MSQALIITGVLLSLLLSTFSHAMEARQGAVIEVAEHSVTTHETGPWTCIEKELPGERLLSETYRKLYDRAEARCGSYVSKVGGLRIDYEETAEMLGNTGRCEIIERLSLTASFRCHS